jgi:membrane associated rhomboid family serine protease
VADTRRAFLLLVAYVALWDLAFVGVEVYQSFIAPLARYGLLPRHPEGLVGVVASPLIHQGWGHLLSNLSSFTIGWGMILVFYSQIAHRVLGLIWLLTGLGVWLLGRESYHIGASGVVYGVILFLIVSGIVRRNPASLAVAGVILLLNQGLLWGMSPQPGVSWESHIVGAVVGAGVGLLYRKHPGSPLLAKAKHKKLEDDASAETGVWDYEKRIRLRLPEEDAESPQGRQSPS